MKVGWKSTPVDDLIQAEVDAGGLTNECVRNFIASDETEFETNVLLLEKREGSEFIEVDALWGGSDCLWSPNDLLEFVIAIEKREIRVPMAERRTWNADRRKKKGPFKR